jgi:hypothetical protein
MWEKRKLAIERFNFVENKLTEMVYNTFGQTVAALYRPTTGKNALRKGRYMPPKTTGFVTRL